MRTFLITTAAVVALAVPACLLAGESRRITSAEAERDLVLEARLTSPESVMPGAPVTLAVHIRNGSKTLSYPVVRPGDGSEAGWREPHVYYTATVNTGDGVWREVEKRGIGRCGLFDADWHDDVHVLAPGEKLELKDWLTPPHYTLDLQRAGRVRLVVHYRYAAGRLNKRGEALDGPSPGDVGGMRGVEAFELASEPVEFDVVRPIDVEVAARGSVRAGRSTKLSDILDVRLVNRDGAPFHVEDYHVGLVVKPGGLQLTNREGVPAEGKFEAEVLERGERVRLLGSGFAGGRDERITFGSAGTVEVAIEFSSMAGSPRLRSKWIELTVTR